MSEYGYPDDEGQLETWTKNYWERDDDARPDYYLGPQGYGDPLRPLLQIEIECAKERGLLKEPDSGKPTTLAILVGTSFEPLLQAICTYLPDRLVPVVNRFYGDRDELSNEHKFGHMYWQDLRKLIKRIPAALVDCPPLPTITKEETVTDDPQAVFDYLRQQLAGDLADPKRRVVIDITGAKKTMVAGAYLLAAYSQARISYVDFDRWHKGKGKPYGYSCRISDDVSNPLREWALQDWERVEEQYKKYNFSAAIEAIPIRERAVWETASDKLKNFLEVCAAWEAGDLAMAKELHDKLPEDLQHHTPLAVIELSRYWQPLSSGREDWLKPEFLLDPRALVIYAEDELARADRLAKHETRPDNRVAFIRAFAVYETLLKARALILFETNQTTIDPLIADGATLRGWMLEKMLTSQAKDLLAGIMVKGAQKLGTARLKMTCPTSVLETDEENLTRYRHLFVHSYVPVSSNHVGNVIKMTRAHLDEFKNNWGNAIVTNFDKHEKLEPLVFAAPDWETLKRDCGLDVLIPVKNIER